MLSKDLEEQIQTYTEKEMGNLLLSDASGPELLRVNKLARVLDFL